MCAIIPGLRQFDKYAKLGHTKGDVKGGQRCKERDTRDKTGGRAILG
jgi:hypothetical protein